MSAVRRAATDSMCAASSGVVSRSPAPRHSCTAASHPARLKMNVIGRQQPGRVQPVDDLGPVRRRRAPRPVPAPAGPGRGRAPPPEPVRRPNRVRATSRGLVDGWSPRLPVAAGVSPYAGVEVVGAQYLHTDARRVRTRSSTRASVEAVALPVCWHVEQRDRRVTAGQFWWRNCGQGSRTQSEAQSRKRSGLPMPDPVERQRRRLASHNRMVLATISPILRP